jgi:PAS domain S-box-containing protein
LAREAETPAIGVEPLSVVDQLGVAVVTTDRTGAIVGWSRGAEALFGYGAAEMLGQSGGQTVIRAEDRDEVAALMARTLAGEPYQGQLPMQTKDGRQLIVSLRADPLRDAAGEVVGTVTVATDFWSGDGPAPRAMVEALFGQTPVGVALFDTAARYLRINPTLARIRDVVVGEAVGRRPDEVLPAGIGEAVTKVVREVLATGVPQTDIELPGRVTEDRVAQTLIASFHRLDVEGTGPVGVAEVVIDITNERLARDRSQRLADRLTVLRGMTERLFSAVGIAAVGRVLVRAVAHGLHADATVLLGVEPDTDRLTVLDQTGDWGPFLEHVAGSRLSDPTLPAEVLRGGQTLVWRNPREHDPRYPQLPPQLRAYAFLPLVSGRRPVGLVCLGYRHDQEFGAEEEALIVAVGQQCALALDRARLFEAEREARAAAEANRDRLAVLAEAGRLLTASLDYESTLRQMTRVLIPVLADSVSVLLWDENGLRSVATAHVDPKLDAVMRDMVQESGGYTYSPVLQDVGRSGTTIFTPRLTDGGAGAPLTAQEQADMQQLEVRSGIVVPLRGRERILGVIALTMSTSGREYTDIDLETVEQLARRMSLSIENSLAHRASTEVAVTLQRSLLPRSLPAAPGLVAAFRYESGTAGTEVGGDWIDLLRLSAGRTGIVVGDVMGRGMHAAAVMGQLRTAVRAFAELDMPPTDLLVQLNRLVSGFEEGQLTTCLYATYDPITRQLSFANAGHLPPVLYSAAEKACHLLDASTYAGLAADRRGPLNPVRQDEPADLPLGVGHARYVLRSVGLAPGDLFVVYTDGLVENRERDVTTGMDQLCDIVNRHHRAPLDALCDAIIAELAPSGSRDDDVALLVVALEPGSEPVVRRFELPTDPRSVHVARDKVRDVLAEWAVAGLDDLAPLIVGELVTNAMRHARGPIELAVRRLPASVVVEVADADSRLPRLRRATLWEEGGRGLLFVEALSDRWGARSTPTGKVVWAELPANPNGFAG